MLYLKIPALEGYDAEKEEFVILKAPVVLQMEHSLLSISKWESRWCKPFFGRNPKTLAEIIDYIRCMTINKNVDESAYERLTKKHIDAVSDYMSTSRTATKLSKPKTYSMAIPTSEEYYYSMFYYGIPKECEQWHFSRLIALLDIANKKNAPVKKKTQRELNKYYAELNAMRLAETGSKG